MRPDDERVVPTFLSEAVGGRDLTVHESGSQNVLVLPHGRHNSGLCFAHVHEREHGYIVNLGSESEITIAELAQLGRNTC